tara:strand:+ start:1945 stop:2790 length:846 start_codon:yes stop_codon:yes gene_type:complete
MKKILLSFLIVGFMYAGMADLSVSSCLDNGDGTVTFSLNMQSDAPLYGFQFTVDPGANLNAGAGAAGGLAAGAGWLVQIGANGTILGFSMNGTSIEPQTESGTLTELSFEGSCDGGMNLFDAEPGATIEVWGTEFTFGGHSFSSFECSDPMYTTLDDCSGAGFSWESTVLDYTWNSGTTESTNTFGQVIKEFKLNKNYPNPFNPSTTIVYDVASAGDVKLSVYNMKGQEINVLAQGYHGVDSYSVVWNGKDNSGSEMPAGIYIYKLVADGFIQSNKMSFVK